MAQNLKEVLDRAIAAAKVEVEHNGNPGDIFGRLYQAVHDAISGVSSTPSTGTTTPPPATTTPPVTTPPVTTPPVTTPPVTTPPTTTPAPSTGTPAAKKEFLIYKGTNAGSWALANKGDGRAALILALASIPVARWLGNWTANLYEQVKADCTDASKSGKVPVFIPYNMINRDVGGYSAGGADSLASYKKWIDELARGVKDGLGGSKVRPIALLEPDALPHMAELSGDARNIRNDAVSYAGATLTAAGCDTYFDVGHPDWIKDVVKVADILVGAGVSKMKGFSINISNFQTTQACIEYGNKIVAELKKRGITATFIIDTSRNGVGYQGTWCNPANVKIGDKPAFNPAPNVDAFVFGKVAGESDGECGKGDPSAGTFMPQVAFEMAHNTWLAKQVAA